jgi:hypothetical protein
MANYQTASTAARQNSETSSVVPSRKKAQIPNTFNIYYTKIQSANNAISERLTVKSRPQGESHELSVLTGAGKAGMPEHIERRQSFVATRLGRNLVRTRSSSTYETSKTSGSKSGKVASNRKEVVPVLMERIRNGVMLGPVWCL